MQVQSRIILLAEDDDDDSFFVMRAMKHVPVAHTLIHVTNGEDCIAYLGGKPPYDDHERFPLPALLLLDLKLPRKDGFDVLCWLQQHAEIDVPVIVLSGSAFDRDRTEALRLGAREFHQKLADLEDTAALAEGICARWLSGSAARAG